MRLILGPDGKLHPHPDEPPPKAPERMVLEHPDLDAYKTAAGRAQFDGEPPEEPPEIHLPGETDGRHVESFGRGVPKQRSRYDSITKRR